MATLRFKLLAVAGFLAGLAVNNIALAGLGSDLRYGLQLYGIKYEKRYDPLSKGYLLNISVADPQTGTPYYNNTHFYMGFADLVLGSEDAGAIQIGATYTERVLPAARFVLKTTDPFGNPSPLDYRFESFLGANDFTVNGSLLLDIDTYVNRWGFYDISLQASNRATITANPQPPEERLPNLNYDIGPINLTGNIYVDVLAAVTDPFFEAFGTQNPFARLDKGLAGLDLKSGGIQDLIARLEAGQLLGDDELARLINNSIMANMLGKAPSDDLIGKLIVPDGLLDPKPIDPVETVLIAGLSVPEPGMLLLLTAAAAGFYLSPRRRRRR